VAVTQSEEDITINGRPAVLNKGGGGNYRHGGITFEPDLPSTSTRMIGRRAYLTGTRVVYVAWEKGAGQRPQLMLRAGNRSNYTTIAEMDPDDAETLALAILEAVKQVRTAE
jgi:hypothetical protein